ncbi:hypothetical protein BDZ90DRAFT_137529 [Jaminaea rosea]|uniref:N-acetyltransferase domain-containing protein n=1 Tax=Jaminaea rosea TaxID=1569628 RepID=A0A316UUP3_9BASI|nr:hypothetical protein BDZ90DRAFT_137529 [Jaminaea rosea]PWN29030.1 hypothetical protein BDZ90DRAFT_137529 [Jaminaea rosea]
MGNSTVESSGSIYEVSRPRWPRFNEPNLDRVFAPQDNGDDKDNDGAISRGASSFVYDRHDFFLGYWGDDVKPPQHFEEVNCEERPLLGICSGHTLCGQVYIELLWVKKLERKKGLLGSGARLLREAELLGIRRCQARGAYLNTFTTQGAEPFYASQGYKRLMVIPGTVDRVYMGKTPLQEERAIEGQLLEP